MSQHDMTAEEFFNSLTGFDEIAIKRAFTVPVTQLADTDQMAFARALVFVALRRQGQPDAEAKSAALEMTIGQVTGYFADEEDEVMPEAPETEQGKGG